MSRADTHGMGARPAITIGTSGWNYRHWRGDFYPPGLAQHEWLRFYAEQFRSVELNSTFYRLPSRETAAGWVQQAPADFRFAVKASRYITHLKKLNDCDAAVARLVDVADALGDKMGPLLFQLPPRWRANPTRLQAFLAALPDRHRYVFEFRDPSWWTEDVYRLLHQHRVALCQYSLAAQSSPEMVTCDFVYVRLHGPQPGYAGSYTDGELRSWAHKLRAWQKDGRGSFVYFDNDADCCATHDAHRLRALCRTAAR